ncbi:MAG: TetR/AcrR family transcriptional regulator [Bacteroidales bacterium]|nr:TetR/AcrR family transcriptional regulator [Bacteroidales bacterium]MDD2424463.1 TetR/AcrR family transcriptional regulator [Bacteroidales bacterium]MDD3990488.1 TetR/AcrR family transcriptional regulator [Bacteroidales bacterium]MDD4638766.1 TetR/AcrR family transcriptional regulator [Bacteroidales bacterium]
MDLRERIIENSTTLFLSRGCKSVTMDDIAAENGISKRTLYELFSEKSNLLEESIFYIYNKLKSDSEKITREKGNIYEIIFKAHESQSEININLRANFFSELKKFYPVVYEKIFKKFSDFHEKNIILFLERGQKEGLILKTIDNNLVSKMIMEISYIIGDKQVFSLENRSRKELFRQTMLLYFRGISTIEGIKILDERLTDKQI